MPPVSKIVTAVFEFLKINAMPCRMIGLHKWPCNMSGSSLYFKSDKVGIMLARFHKNVLIKRMIYIAAFAREANPTLDGCNWNLYFLLAVKMLNYFFRW